MASFRRTSRKKRARRYWSLRDYGFSSRESYEFSKLTAKYPALKQLITSRQALMFALDAEAKAKRWSDHRYRLEWAGRVGQVYSELPTHKKVKGEGMVGGWTVHDTSGRRLPMPVVSPWMLYDFVFARLPDELKWDTPRGGSRNKQADVDINKVARQRQQWIAELKITVQREPQRRVELARQARRLGFKGAL